MSRTVRLWIVLSLNLALVAGLAAVGILSQSIGVFAEGVDYLADAAAVGMALVALRLSKRPGSPSRPDGYPKATAIAALVNGGWLLALSILVAASSVYRLMTGAPKVYGLPVLVVSATAALVMLIGSTILRADNDDGDDVGADLAMRAILLDTVADAATASGVAISGGVILVAHGLYWLDPAVALVIGSIVGYHASGLVRQSRAVLSIQTDTPNDA